MKARKLCNYSNCAAFSRFHRIAVNNSGLLQIFQIDTEIRDLIPNMTREEYLDLEQSIIERGRAIDPFTVWDGIVLDGVYRYEICLKHGLDFGYNEIDLPDREAAKRWRVDAILARRHLNTFRRIELVEKTRSLYEAEAKKRQGTRNDLKDSGKKFRESSNGGRPVDFKPDDEKDVHRAYSQDADRMTDSAADPQIEKKDKKKNQMNQFEETLSKNLNYITDSSTLNLALA